MFIHHTAVYSDFCQVTFRLPNLLEFTQKLKSYQLLETFNNEYVLCLINNIQCTMHYDKFIMMTEDSTK